MGCWLSFAWQLSRLQMPSAPHKYDTCNYLQQYAGEWRYVRTQDTIRIFLKVLRTFKADYNSTQDLLWGWHEYKRGNTIKQSDYQNRYNNPSSVWGNMYAMTSIWLKQNSGCSSSMIPLTGSIKDYGKSVTHQLRIDMSSNGDTMYLKQWYYGTNGLGTGQVSGMTLPQQLTLIRQ